MPDNMICAFQSPSRPTNQTASGKRPPRSRYSTALSGVHIELRWLTVIADVIFSRLRATIHCATTITFSISSNNDHCILYSCSKHLKLLFSGKKNKFLILFSEQQIWQSVVKCIFNIFFCFRFKWTRQLPTCFAMTAWNKGYFANFAQNWLPWQHTLRNWKRRSR